MISYLNACIELHFMTFSPYKYKDQFLTMFNLKKTGKTTVNDTGTWYRAYNCGINDLWLNYENNKITTSIITYSTFFN